MSALDEFADAMVAAGIGRPRSIEADGGLHRFQGEGDKQGHRNCWYVVYLDDPAAGAFGSWRLGVTATWCAGGGRKALSPAERERLAADIAAARAATDAERKAGHEAAAERAAELWHQGQPADAGHPYLVAKAVQPHGLRQIRETLLVPLRDLDGKGWNLQRISPDGTKRFLPGGRISSLCSPLGDMTDPEKIAICEGWSTAATIREGTGRLVLAAMNCGNLVRVALAARVRWPNADILICGDNDRHTPGNPGVTAARHAAATIGARLSIPEFTDAEAGTDWNDRIAIDRGRA